MDGDDSLFSAGAAELLDGDDLFSNAGSSKNAKVLDGNDSFSSAGSSKDTELNKESFSSAEAWKDNEVLDSKDSFSSAEPPKDAELLDDEDWLFGTGRRGRDKEDGGSVFKASAIKGSSCTKLFSGGVSSVLFGFDRQEDRGERWKFEDLGVEKQFGENSENEWCGRESGLESSSSELLQSSSLVFCKISAIFSVVILSHNFSKRNFLLAIFIYALSTDCIPITKSYIFIKKFFSTIIVLNDNLKYYSVFVFIQLYYAKIFF